MNRSPEGEPQDLEFRLRRDTEGDQTVISVLSNDLYLSFDKSAGAVRFEILDGLNVDIFWRKKGRGLWGYRQVLLYLMSETDRGRNFLGILQHNDTGGAYNLLKTYFTSRLGDHHYYLTTQANKLGDLGWDPYEYLSFPPHKRTLSSPYLGRLSLAKRSGELPLSNYPREDLEIALMLPFYWYHSPEDSGVTDHLATIFPGGELNPYNAVFELHRRDTYGDQGRDFLG